VHCESRVAVAVLREQFGNPEEGGCSLLETGTRGLVKRQQTKEHSMRAVVNCRVSEIELA
jgi:hypothetical protein